jgi:phytoene dehydrogenase-like protein
MSAVTLADLRADYEAAKAALIASVQASVDEHVALSNGHMPTVPFNWLLQARHWTADDFATQTYRKRKDQLQKAVVLAAQRYIEARDGQMDPRKSGDA